MVRFQVLMAMMTVIWGRIIPEVTILYEICILMYITFLVVVFKEVLEITYGPTFLQMLQYVVYVLTVFQTCVTPPQYAAHALDSSAIYLVILLYV